MPRRQLDTKRVNDRFERELRRAVWSEKGGGHPAADRPHEDDPAGRLANQRKEGLRDGDLADDVDFELTPDRVDGQHLQRARDGHAGVVHEGVEARAVERAFHIGPRRFNRVRVGDVKDDGGQPGRALGAQSINVHHAPDPREHPVPRAIEPKGARLANTRRGPGNEDGVHGGIVSEDRSWKLEARVNVSEGRS